MVAWDERLASVDRAEAAAQAGERFGADGCPEFVSLGANLIFRCEIRGSAAYLRVLPTALRSVAELEANLAFQAHLQDRGAPVAPVVTSRRGRRVESFELGDETLGATASGAVPGCAAPPTPDAYAAWGRAMGEMHRAARSFAMPAEGLRSWERSWNEAGGFLPPGDREARAEHVRLAAWLDGLPRGPEFQGVTHADCNRTNALYEGQQVHLIDFDEPTWHWFASDVARPFRELTAEHPAHAACRSAFLQGYRERHGLDAALEEALPRFVRMKNLEIYAWLVGSGDWRGDVLPGGRDRARTLADIRSGFGSD